MRAAWWTWTLWWLAVASCAAAHLSKLPGEGGPRWRELRSPHFVLWTDLPEHDARQTVRTLEDYRTLLVGVLFGDAPAARRGRSLVVAVRSHDDWRLLGAADNLLGLLWPANNVMKQPVLAFVGEDELGFDTERERIIVHELAHLVTYAVLGEHPRWLAEGIATYFEGARIDRRARSGRFGRFPRRLSPIIRDGGWQPFDDVVLDRVPPSQAQTPGYYTSGVILVSFLLNTRPAAFLAYQRRLAEVPPSSHTPLWSELFPDLPPEELPHALNFWVRRGRARELTVQLALEEVAIDERAMSDADVLATRALISAAVPGVRPGESEPRVAAHAAAALALDTTHPLASLLAALVAGRADAEQARAVTEAHPDDYLGWLLRVAATTGEARRRAFARLCTLVGDNPAIDLSRIGRCAAVSRSPPR